EVDLLSSYSVHGIAIRLGQQSSPILNVYLIHQNGELHVSFLLLCNTSGYAFIANTTVYLHCELANVAKVRIVAEYRLQLCEARVYATNGELRPFNCEQTKFISNYCRGATLPMKITETAQRGLRAALKSSTHQKDFYWIGVTSSLTNWRWADGAVVTGEEADWSGSPIQPSSRQEAIVLARVAEWKWIPSAQNVWNSFLCQSKPKLCAFPGISDAGRVSFTSPNFVIGTRAVYSCELGYEVNGDVERLCDETARWSGTIPKCRKKKCDNLEVWSGGGVVRLLNDTPEYGNEIQYECSNGWKLVGDERRRLVDCEAPPNIPNGQVFVSSTTFESQANYTCMDGYRLIGHDKLICTVKGIWEPAAPMCYDMATLRELRANSTESRAGLAALGVVLAFILVFVVFRFSKTTKSVSITEKVRTVLLVCRPFVRPQLPIFSPSPTPSQLLYSFDYEPIYDVPPDVQQRRPGTFQEENIYEKLPDIKPTP
ncbi:hypothetical protein GCK32_009030, partial [Trichostrongylus colubriformis]